ncbi:MAG TPA: beta-N-acetylglucosaminidase domain-containing protein [Longimicrobiales bacterium]|nr:beta-N-acetylglucosaminidase domain-containing protein [Longimicrobiales bacterium]
MDLGIIEGFYGRPWTWEDRAANAAFLRRHGYNFYLYAPKADPYLRRRWQEPHPDDTAASLRAFAGHCRDIDVRFGVGLSPYEIYQNFDDAARAALADKLAFLDSVGIHYLAILFDDMRGDLPDLATRQVEIIEWIAARTRAERVIVCPTYYSDDPILDRVFGRRPDRYVEDMGKLIDPSIEIFWTGEEVVSREISVGHAQRVTEQLQRKPFLWDNYPVNDGQRMWQYLHLRGFTGRPAGLADHLTAHGVNPALQPTLTRIPALTLVESYERGSAYQYTESFGRAAVEVLGSELGAMLRDDVLILQDVGLDRLGEKEALLRERYEGLDQPGAREIIDWLNGGYRITDEIVHTQ